MFTDFRIPVEDTLLFCRHCQKVCKHTLQARYKLVSGVPAPRGEPLTATCQQCSHSQFYFCGEFRFFSEPPAKDGAFKIAGRSRLVVKDNVYVPGSPTPGVVQKRFRQNQQETFCILQDDGSEQQYQQTLPSQYSEDALLEWLLIPLHLNTILIGDPVYHIKRNQFGHTVGMIFGRETKLVVQLENNTLLLIVLPNSRQIADNNTLTKAMQNLLVHSLPNIHQHIQIQSGQGILFLSGVCSHLKEVRKIRDLSQQMEGCRGIVDHINVQPLIHISDDILTQQMLSAAIHNQGAIFGLEVRCQNAHASIKAFCRTENARSELLDTLESIDGLQKLDFDVRLRLNDPVQERERTQAVAQALRKNSTLRNAQIRVSSINGMLLLEGFVASNMQKGTASIASVWSGKNLHIENHLVVNKTLLQGDPFIRIS